MTEVRRIHGDFNNSNLDGGTGNKLDPRKETVKLSDLPEIEVPDSEIVPAAKPSKGKAEKSNMKRAGVTGSMTIGGNVDSSSNIINASGARVEGTGKVVQDKLDNITFNDIDEAQKLEITRKRYSRLHTDIKYVEDQEGLDSFLQGLAEDGHFATSDFLLEEYAKANGYTEADGQVRSLATVLAGSRKINVDVLKVKLESREKLNPFQKLLLQTINDLAK